MKESYSVIALLGSMDTKREEMLYAKDIIERNGKKCILVDMSTWNLDNDGADIRPKELLSGIGISLDEFDRMDKPERVGTMGIAMGKRMRQMCRSGAVQGVLAIGGGQNAQMAAETMRTLPFGIPKMIASPMISGNRKLEQYIGTKDIMLVHTVADVEGLNSVTCKVIENCCLAMIGMTDRMPHMISEQSDERIRIAITTLGITTPCADGIRELLPDDLFEVTCFHANGVGGRCMEELIREGMFDLVLDLNLHEITCEQLGGYCRGANNRLTAAAERKIPMLVAPGAIDMIDFFQGEGEEFPKAAEGRKFIRHNKNIIHEKVTAEEAVQIAEVVAERLKAGDGLIELYLPTGGFSTEAKQDAPLADREVDRRFMEEMQNRLDGIVPVYTVEDDINGFEFQKVIADRVLELGSELKKEKTINLIKGEQGYEKKIS